MEARLPVANGSIVETDGYCARCGKFAELGEGKPGYKGAWFK